jgi:hypothetical protein
LLDSSKLARVAEHAKRFSCQSIRKTPGFAHLSNLFCATWGLAQSEHLQHAFLPRTAEKRSPCECRTHLVSVSCPHQLPSTAGPFESVSPFFGILTWRNLRGLLYTREVTANGLSSRAGALVRHAGWIASCALAAVLFLVGGANASWAARLGAAATALDALTSDLLLAGKRGGSCECARGGGGRSRWVFRCGNFGIILLNPEYRDIALEVPRPPSLSLSVCLSLHQQPIPAYPGPLQGFGHFVFKIFPVTLR